ncbi:membrane protein [Intrasporangium oryzae NRRL B-24470]|uniref:Membrane protein n=1 Tax=Intrasporangium oryzae NRRL B-24470 TaxID=1386089 RepID=W9G6U2_9MICO|nr:DUF1707 domain-containing protein [Intrasporangium oryzae]EWT01916.1 membrane protein [Intrasporangium oryzae NRRL B-24470]
MTDDREIRVGEPERQRALELLALHFAAGRLDPDEYEDRRGRATDAITRGELNDLFTDLPAVDDKGQVVERRPPAGMAARHRNPSQLIMGLVPFVAVGLFLATGRWWWFLLIPVAGVVARYLDGNG